jgi:hypothetical protein
MSGNAGLPTTGIWPGVFELIDRQNDHDALEWHGLLPLAVAHWQEQGRSLSRELAAARARSAALQLEAEALVETIRDITDSPFLLLKGLEVAACYPQPSLRRLRDVDVLFGEPVAMRDLLLERGWEKKETAGFDDEAEQHDELHQLAPISCPGRSLPVEIHHYPNAPKWSTPPTFDELLIDAVPAQVNIDGVLAPSPVDHALIVLMHSCARQPFEQVSQLIDLSLLLDRCDRRELHRIARRRGLGRLLTAAVRTIESLFMDDGREPFTIRYCAGHLRSLGVPSPRRRQWNRYVASFALTSPSRAAAGAWRGVVNRARVIRRRARVDRGCDTGTSQLGQ